MKVFDAHAHIYPAVVAEKAVTSLGKFYDFTPDGLGTTDDYIESSVAAGCEGFLILGVATNARQTPAVNDFIADFIRESSNNGFDAYVFMGINQDIPDIESEVKRSMEKGLCGVKIHPDIQQVDPLDPRLYRLYEILQQLNLPICFHVGDVRPRYRYSEPGKIAKVAKDFPKLRICAAHFGGYSVFEEGRNVLSGLGNVWVDCSSSLWLITPEYAHELIIAFGPDRVMFGTDYPVKYCDDELKRFAELPLAAEERDDILWNNAHKYILGE